MKLVATLALAAALAVPAAAQVIPDEFPDPSDGFADRAQRELIERHRPFLSGLFATSSFAVGPEIGTPRLVGAATGSGGYRFGSGDAIALTSAFRMPLAQSPITGAPEAGFTASLEAEYIVALGRAAERRSVLRGTELGLAIGASAFDGPDGVAVFAPTVSLHPRVAIPLTGTTAVPVGLRVSQVLSAAAGGPYVGVSLGFRRIWADAARMVLE